MDRGARNGLLSGKYRKIFDLQNWNRHPLANLKMKLELISSAEIRN